jgi:hypothetical protein
MFTTDGLLMKIGKDERGFAKRSDQPADSARLLECVARWQLGTLEALFGTKGSVTLGNRQLPSLRFGQQTFVSGKALCQAKGWTYQLDNLTAQLRFTTPKGKVIVPLASPEVQLGGARLKYGGITVAVDDDIYVPLGLAQTLW